MKQVFKDRLATRLAHLDQHFAKNAYLMGETFTVADGYCFTVLRWTVPMKIDLAPYPNIQAYMKRVEARPGVQAAMKAEGLI